VRRIETLAADSTSLKSYLREIAKFPTLTTDEERELGRRIQQRADRDALGALVESNLRFVASYASRYRKLGIPVLDLIHEGNLALVESARRFDPNRTESFIAHAAWWVRQSIMHVLSETIGIAALETELEHAAAVGATPDQLPGAAAARGSRDAVEIDVTEDDRAPASRGADVAARVTGRRRRKGLALADVLPDLTVLEIEDDVMRGALVQQIECAMVYLTPRERQVMRLRYGLHADEALSVQQIAGRLRVSRDRVRRIEARAEQRLRRGTSLRSYLN
jgi:RNA polymerase primary sigma factor